MSDEVNDTLPDAPDGSGSETAVTTAPEPSLSDTLTQAVESIGKSSAQTQPSAPAQGQDSIRRIPGSDQPAEPEPDYLTMLAEKYGDPKDPTFVSKLAKAHVHAERKLGELGAKASESEKLQQKLEAIQAQLAGGTPNARQPQQSDFMSQWQSHPLSNMPDPLREQEKYQSWYTETFMPSFQYDPVGTLRHFILPDVVGIADELRSEFARAREDEKFKNEFNSFWESAPQWTGGKPIKDTFQGWGPEAKDEFRQLVAERGMPHAEAVELMALRRNIAPLRAQASESQAKAADERAMASGLPSRGPTAESPETDLGDGDTLQEKMHNALRKKGVDLGPASVKNYKMTAK